MRYEKPLKAAVFVRRYKRFLADVALSQGEILTVHCPNTGSMKNCLLPGSACWLLDSGNTQRKYLYSWELASCPGGHIAGINTGRANTLVVEAINNGVIKELQTYDKLSCERRYGNENSRIDVLLQKSWVPEQHCYVEVKSVTLADDSGRGFFPDSVSVRASKHLRELIAMVDAGHRSVLCFCVQHSGINIVSPADDIDPVYAASLRDAIAAGVEVIAYAARITSEEIVLNKSLPVMM